MKFREEEIQRVVSNQKNYSLIQRMKDYDLVDRFVIDENIHTAGHSIFANLSVSERKYSCSLECDDAYHVSEYRCNCPYSTEVSACAHIGVIMELVNRLDPAYFPFYYQKEQYFDYESHYRNQQLQQNLRSSKHYIDQEKERIMDIQIPSSEKISLIAHLKKERYGYDDETFMVGFKIGIQRKYIVKNIKQLLKDIVMENHYRYGKEFVTDHKKDMFTRESQSVLDFIRNAVLFVEESPNFNQKEIRLDEHTIDRFYDIFSTHAQSIDVKFEEVDLAKEKIPLNAMVEKEYIELSLEQETKYIFGKKALYRFKKQLHTERYHLIKYDVSGNEKAVDFLRKIMYQSFVLDTASIFDFNRFIYHDIKEYFRVSGYDFDQIRFEDRLELYGDLGQEDEVEFKIKTYVNGEVQNETFILTPTSSLDFIRTLELLKRYQGVLDESSGRMVFDLNRDETLAFLREGLEALQSFVDIYISENLKHIRLNMKRTIRVGLTFSNDLLSVDLEGDDIPMDELSGVLSAYKEKKKFYRLKSGEMIALQEDAFADVSEFLEKIGRKPEDLQDGSVYVNPYRIFSLETLAKGYDSFSLTKSESFIQHIQSIQTIDKQAFSVPDTIHASLRAYQVEGYQWLRTLHAYGLGGILADDMGLGKTLQIITYFSSFAHKGLNLVVCPSSVLLNWEQEIKKFARDLSVLTLSGTKQNRLDLLDQASHADIIVTSYDYLRRDIDVLQELDFSCVVLDEAQYIKNHNTQNSKAVKKLQAHQRFALTGTPVENSLAELWSIFDFLMPGYLYGYSYFREHFETPIIKDQDQTISKNLKELVSPFILRRLKADVLKDLPEKTEVDMLIEFSEEEKKLYYANLAQVNRELEEVIQKEKGSEIQILAMLTRLRRLCCEPRTIYDNIRHRSSKMEAAVRFISDVKQEGKKVLLFSSFTSVLDLFAKELEQEGMSYRMIDGRVDKVKRQERILEFQEGDVDVFLISLRAGGTGINLTNAEVVIHFDPWWNISAQNQATDRAYRIGQNKNVLVYKFIMKGSIEEKIQLLQERKKQLSDAFVEDSDGSIAIMNRQEIISLFTTDHEML